MAASKPCHNCRKRRLRCDRSVPGCNKCSALGQECLGYGKIFQWTNAVASRGHMAGRKTFATPARKAASTRGSIKEESAVVRRQQYNAAIPLAGAAAVTMLTTLTDPLFHHMDDCSRFYLNYFTRRICQELVLYDSTKLAGNPFRQLVAMSTAFPFLQHILVASSAMHFANNLRRKASTPDYARNAVDSTVDALYARGKAIKALQVVLDRQDASDGDNPTDENDALLATVLFFINFDLIDSGKGGWRAHMAAARALVGVHAASYASIKAEDEGVPKRHILSVEEFQDGRPLALLSPPAPSSNDRTGIRHYIASDAVVYYIWGGTLDCLSKSGARRSIHIPVDISGIQSILYRTEANSYHSCPSQLLLLILRTSRLTREVYADSPDTQPSSEQLDQFIDLLKEAQDFNPEAWAIKISMQNAEVVRPDEIEIRLRTYAAATYRATTCLYLLQAVPGLRAHIRKRSLTASRPDELPFLPTAKDLATTIMQTLSLIPESSPIFKYSVWPLFITGVEAPTPENRAWISRRLDLMWDICPWGMMQSAVETLAEIWKWKDATLKSYVKSADGEDDSEISGADSPTSLMRLRSIGVEFLVV